MGWVFLSTIVYWLVCLLTIGLAGWLKGLLSAGLSSYDVILRLLVGHLYLKAKISISLIILRKIFFLV